MVGVGLAAGCRAACPRRLPCASVPESVGTPGTGGPALALSPSVVAARVGGRQGPPAGRPAAARAGARCPPRAPSCRVGVHIHPVWGLSPPQRTIVGGSTEDRWFLPRGR